MSLTKLKIGYVPYLPDLSQPGDRRRFPYFARRYNISFEIANPNKEYDIIVLTGSSDLSAWFEYKNKHPHTKFIFEMVDSLLFYPDLFTKWFKGLGRFLLGKEKRVFLDYSRLLMQWIKSADVVLCSNEVLRNAVAEFNNCTVLSPDYLESEYRLRKHDFEIRGKMKLVWEGQPAVLPHFNKYKDMFRQISSFCELYIISNSYYPVIPKLYSIPIEKFLKKLPITTYYYEWSLETHNDILVQGDCAIIPLDKRNQYGWNKPANKLISFWFSGIPTIVSKTPAYQCVMDDAGSDQYCQSTAEWVEKIKMMYESSPVEREKMANKNFNYAVENYSDENLDKIWENVFSMVM